jgi:hypothetical protein
VGYFDFNYQIIANTSTAPITVQQIALPRSPANQKPLAALKHRTALVHPLTRAPGLLSIFRSFIPLCLPYDHFRPCLCCNSIGTARKTVENRLHPRSTLDDWRRQLENSSAPIAVAARAARVTANPRRAIQIARRIQHQPPQRPDSAVECRVRKALEWKREERRRCAERRGRMIGRLRST